MDQPLNPLESLEKSSSLENSKELKKENGRLQVSFLKGVLGILFGFALGFLVLRWTGVSRSDLLAKVALADPTRIILGVFGGFILTCTQAIRWQAILRGIAPTVRFSTIFQSKLVGYAANSVLPARLGDLVRIEFVSTITGVPRTKILATGVTDLWFDKLGWILTFGIAYFVAPMPEWVLKAMSIMGALIFGSGGALLLLSKWKKKSSPDSILGKFREGLDQPHFGKLFIQQLWLSPLSWIWESLLILFVAKAFEIDLNFAQAFAVLTAFNISMVVPIPANAGVFEAAATYALTAFGVEADRAVAFSLIYHLVLLIPGVTVGATIFGVKTGQFKFFRRVAKAPAEPISGRGDSR